MPGRGRRDEVQRGPPGRRARRPPCPPRPPRPPMSVMSVAPVPPVMSVVSATSFAPATTLASVAYSTAHACGPSSSAYASVIVVVRGKRPPDRRPGSSSAVQSGHPRPVTVAATRTAPAPGGAGSVSTPPSGHTEPASERAVQLRHAPRRRLPRLHVRRDYGRESVPADLCRRCSAVARRVLTAAARRRRARPQRPARAPIAGSQPGPPRTAGSRHPCVSGRAASGWACGGAGPVRFPVAPPTCQDRQCHDFDACPPPLPRPPPPRSPPPPHRGRGGRRRDRRCTTWSSTGSTSMPAIRPGAAPRPAPGR